MPLYTFEDKTTGERQEIRMKISELDSFREENPHLKTVITGAPAIGDSIRLGLKKPDNGFREVLQKVKENHKGSRTVKNTINDF